MRFDFLLPAIVPEMTHGKIYSILAKEGAQIRVGGALLEIAIDLSNIVAHDCPPIFLYRVFLREAAWLRKLLVKQDDLASVGAPLAVLSTTASEPLEENATRPIRVSLAGVLW
jgi:pyruvate/2-oxoglutarate dehydrogenase complex dihydrolipoamide acyltransferase (E2) component